MNDTATKWWALNGPGIRQMQQDDLERKGLAAMTDDQAEQSYHRWRAWVKRTQMARGGK